MRRSSLLLSALVITASGCYHYVPVSEAPTYGAAIQTHLERPIPVELTDITANNVVRIRGEVIAADADQLVLSAFRIWGANGLEQPLRGETVRIPTDLVGLMEVKRFSTVRTALATVGLAAGSYLIQAALRAAVGGGEGEGPSGPVR
jgi:hypothetical protein